MESEARKETNKLVKWNVGIPRINCYSETKSFEVDGYNWKFCLETSISDPDGSVFYHSQPKLPSDEEWLLKLNRCDGNNRPPFPLQVFIRDKGKDLYLSQVEISSKSTVIWKTFYSDFKRKYPDVQVVGACLQFVFDFFLAVPDPEIPIKVEKSVQTSKKSVHMFEKFVQVSDPNLENHPCLENLSLDLSKLVEGGTDTDVQLKCGDVSIGAHKMILGARSEVFRTMMQSDMVEGREGIVKIIDMEPKILKIFIRYIYTGNLPELPVDTALPIYEAADKYQVEALKKRSGQFLLKNLSPENALVILVAADAHSDSDLKDRLVPYISEEKIHSRKEEWLKFCNECPRLANEVLNFMLYQESPSIG